MRGEPLELVARELNVTAARLSSWRDQALLAAEAALKERERDARDDEIARLKGKVGAMPRFGTVRNEEPFGSVRKGLADSSARPNPTGGHLFSLLWEYSLRDRATKKPIAGG